MDKIKQQIIELLEFPAFKMQGQLQLDGCPHAGFYDVADERCIDCFQGVECQFVGHSESITSCQKKAMARLISQLKIGIDYIDVNLQPNHRSRRRCYCENCSWLERANAILIAGETALLKS
jgi:hypothetical protein